MAGFQEKKIRVNDVQLRYLDWGTAGQTPLICLHGHTGQAHIWDEFAEAMSPHYHVLAVDQRGHGGSEWAKSGYARDRFVEDLTAFAAALRLPRFVLVGLSMGGWNSLLYAADHPERVERMIVVDIGPEPGSRYMEQATQRAPRPLEFATFEDGVAWSRAQNPWAAEERAGKDARDKLRQREDGRWTWKADPALFVTPLPDMVEQALIDRYWKALETISCPILLVRALKSVLLSDELVERMAATAQQLHTLDVAEAGHNVTLDKPEAFVAGTAAFLGVSS